jgi:MbtH protein
MSSDNTLAGESFRVVTNHDEQFSIWPAERELPSGWADAGIRASRADCLAHIGTVWSDMRPASLRQGPVRPDLQQ